MALLKTVVISAFFKAFWNNNISIRFLILIIMACLQNFSMQVKTGLSWVVLERCVSSLYIFKFLTKELKKFWKIFVASISLEMIPSFSTSAIFSFDLILLEKGGEIFNKFKLFNKFRKRRSHASVFWKIFSRLLYSSYENLKARFLLREFLGHCMSNLSRCMMALMDFYNKNL